MFFKILSGEWPVTLELVSVVEREGGEDDDFWLTPEWVSSFIIEDDVTPDGAELPDTDSKVEEGGSEGDVDVDKHDVADVALDEQEDEDSDSLFEVEAATVLGSMPPSRARKLDKKEKKDNTDPSFEALRKASQKLQEARSSRWQLAEMLGVDPRASAMRILFHLYSEASYDNVSKLKFWAREKKVLKRIDQHVHDLVQINERDHMKVFIKEWFEPSNKISNPDEKLGMAFICQYLLKKGGDDFQKASAILEDDKFSENIKTYIEKEVKKLLKELRKETPTDKSERELKDAAVSALSDTEKMKKVIEHAQTMVESLQKQDDPVAALRKEFEELRDDANRKRTRQIYEKLMIFTAHPEVCPPAEYPNHPVRFNADRWVGMMPKGSQLQLRHTSKLGGSFSAGVFSINLAIGKEDLLLGVRQYGLLMGNKHNFGFRFGHSYFGEVGASVGASKEVGSYLKLAAEAGAVVNVKGGIAFEYRVQGKEHAVDFLVGSLSGHAHRVKAKPGDISLFKLSQWQISGKVYAEASAKVEVSTPEIDKEKLVDVTSKVKKEVAEVIAANEDAQVNSLLEKGLELASGSVEFGFEARAEAGGDVTMINYQQINSEQDAIVGEKAVERIWTFKAGVTLKAAANISLFGMDLVDKDYKGTLSFTYENTSVMYFKPDGDLSGHTIFRVARCEGPTKHLDKLSLKAVLPFSMGKLAAAKSEGESKSKHRAKKVERLLEQAVRASSDIKEGDEVLYGVLYKRKESASGKLNTPNDYRAKSIVRLVRKTVDTETRNWVVYKENALGSANIPNVISLSGLDHGLRQMPG